jgi:hypothetical protein
MRIILSILILLFCLDGFSQQFNYTGYIYNSVDSPLSGATVNLYTKLTVPYAITYPSYPTGVSYNTGTVVPSSDDIVTGPYNIGFNFTFFGNTYTQFYICSNGWIGFTAGQTNGYTAAYIPNSSSAKNVIMCDWEDLYPGSANIYYTTTGTVSNRKLIVSFYNCPHYSCRTFSYTFQFVLYETSNVIDLNMLSKPQCGGYLATQGLVNSTNTVVVPVGGRNASAWSVSAPETIRFTPTTPATSWSLAKTVYTNSSGYYTFHPSGLDINNYLFRVEIPNVPLGGLSSTDVYPLSDIVINKTVPTNRDNYRYDVNNDNSFTISDIFGVYGKISGLIPSWITGVPSYRIFTASQWTTVKTSTTNTKLSIPGTQNMIIDPALNGGSANYYVIRTGFKK